MQLGWRHSLCMLSMLLPFPACTNSSRLIEFDAGRRDAAADAEPPVDAPPAVECDGCLVDAVCYPAGEVDAVEPCRICDPARSTTAFSNNDGIVCDDGNFCTREDVCMAGVCTGAARSCDDGIACTDDGACDDVAAACKTPQSSCGEGQVCDATSNACALECFGGCLIGAVCYGDGQANPLNPCQQCVAAESRTAWSAKQGGSCDDGDFCTVDDVCSGGSCVGGGARNCDDGITCNGAESCSTGLRSCQRGAVTCGANQVCDAQSNACVDTCTGCVIGGVCYGDGQRDPANQCQVCRATNKSAWTTYEGASCDDGLFCTQGDVCTGTTCGGTARNCNDGIACNGVESCDETADACSAGTTTCATGTLCSIASDSCVTTCSGCVIEGVCYGEGQSKPGDPCLSCQTLVSRSAWSYDDGARCDDGQFCTVDDRCGQGVCVGSARSCSDGVACNGVESCDEVGDACGLGSSTCAATEVCNTSADQCVTTCAGCVIGGVCFADGSRNPANSCEICDVNRSRSAFSVNDGASCDDGLFCTRGDVCSGGQCAGSAADFCSDGIACNGVETCNETSDSCVAGANTCASGQVCSTATDSCDLTCAGCAIGGVCYALGTRNPADQCQVCDASQPTAWSVNLGASCDDGLFCTTADICSAAGTCVGAARDCSDGVACNGTESCDEAADRCASGTTTCAAGTVCSTASDSCVVTCAGCTIAGVCHASGAVNPANACEVCQTSAPTVWSARTGVSCDDGAYCTVGESCSSAGVCSGGTPRDCSDGVTCNGAETCNEGTDRCDAGSTTCTGGQICDTASNTCVLSCAGGTTRCGSSCVNTTNDAVNCGGCGVTCNPTQTCVASACAELIYNRDCAALHNSAPTLPSGVYNIDPDGAGPGLPFAAYCDMSSSGGGWTRIIGTTAYRENYGQTSSAIVSSFVAAAALPGVHEAFAKVLYFNEVMLLKTAGNNNVGDFAVYRLVETVAGRSVLDILREDCAPAACSSGNNTAHDGARVTRRIAVSNQGAWTNQYSGQLTGGALQMRNVSNSIVPPSYFFMCGISITPDHDQSVLAFTDQTGSSNNWGDSWRGDHQYGTIWSFWNGDYHNCPTTAHIGNGYGQGFAGWKGLNQPWSAAHQGSYEVYLRLAP